MASLRKESDRGRTGWRLQFRQGGKRRSLCIGDVSKRVADTVARHVEELARAKDANTTPAADAAKWAAGLDGRMRDTLCNWGLADPIQNRNADSDRFLGPFCDKYIAGRSDLAQGTIDNYLHARRLLVQKFGERHLMGAITAADAERWRRWLLAIEVKWDADGKPIKMMAEATVSKHVKRAKTIFAEAVKDRLLVENPFLAVKTGSEVNRDRDYFITRPSATAVLAACPDDDWRLIFSLARFGGLRRCEILTIGWADILWDVNRLRIQSPKTGLRFCPIFPELLPFLRASFESAPDGATRCIQRYHRLANLGTQMNRVIESAGIVPWEKTFNNLRSTRRTELQERHQDHVVNSWMGHSSATAEKHYLQITDEHWLAGAMVETGDPLDLSAIGGVRGGVIGALSQAFEVTGAQKNPVFLTAKESETPGNVSIATPQGLH